MKEATKRRLGKRQRDEKIRSMRAEGYSYKKISDELRIPESTVYCVATRRPELDPFSLEAIEKKCTKEDRCWIWTNSIRSGVPRTWIDGTQYRVRQLVYAATHEDAPIEKMYNARCGNEACVAPEHVVMVDRGALNADQVHDIVRLRKDGWTMDKIASKFGVSSMTVNSIVSGETWRHVTKIGEIDD